MDIVWTNPGHGFVQGLSSILLFGQISQTFGKHGHTVDKAWTHTGLFEIIWTKLRQTSDIDIQWTDSGKTLDIVSSVCLTTHCKPSPCLKEGLSITDSGRFRFLVHKIKFRNFAKRKIN